MPHPDLYKDMSLPESNNNVKEDLAFLSPLAAFFALSALVYSEAAFLLILLPVLVWMLFEKTAFGSTLLWRFRGENWWEHPEVREIRRGLKDVEVGIEGDPAYGETKEDQEAKEDGYHVHVEWEPCMFASSQSIYFGTDLEEMVLVHEKTDTTVREATCYGFEKGDPVYLRIVSYGDFGEVITNDTFKVGVCGGENMDSEKQELRETTQEIQRKIKQKTI